MSIEQQIEKEMLEIQQDVASGKITAEEGKQLIEELQEVYSALGDAEKEIAVRIAAQAIALVSKFISS